MKAFLIRIERNTGYNRYEAWIGQTFEALLYEGTYYIFDNAIKGYTRWAKDEISIIKKIQDKEF